MSKLKDRPIFRSTKVHKWMIRWSLYKALWRFYIHHCESCGTKLFEFRGVHDTCKKCDLV